MTPRRFIGLMSGTSADAIDAVLLEFQSNSSAKLIAHTQLPMPTLTRETIMALSSGQADSLDQLLRLDSEMATLFADCALQLLRSQDLSPSSIEAIGCHGQTIRHNPPSRQRPDEARFTLQIGDANQIAELTKISVVADFRRRDMAAGGQAAPLVPAFHAFWFGENNTRRVVVNLGGIANLTLLDGIHCIGGFDSGPANGLMNIWAQEHLGEPMDLDGKWAQSGNCLNALLEIMLEEPYFSLAPPKSTGRELFNSAWLSTRLRGDENPADVQATLLELTATSLINAIRQSGFDAQELILCGGGSYNNALKKRISQLAEGLTIRDCDAFGLAADQVEAAAFAWLAKMRIEGKSANVPAVTGAQGPRVLGAIYPA